MDKDHDGTVSKEECLAEVERLLRKAETHNDGTLDVNPHTSHTFCCGAQ